MSTELHGPAARRTYFEQDELLVAPRLLPDAVVDSLASAAERLRPRVVRRALAGYKASGSVSAFDIREVAPEVDAFYKDPTILATLSAVVGAPLRPCPDRDPHGCAFYFYTEPGDHIGWHFDSSHYEGARYTVLVGIVNHTEQSRLECMLYKKCAGRAPERRSIATDPGTLVVFNGDRLWHSVSKLERGGERIVLTLEYVTNPVMRPVKRFISDLKDRMMYFGFRR